MKRLTSIVVVAFALSGALSCAHLHPGAVVSCLENFAPGLVTNAMGVIYQAIEQGLASGNTEAAILISLEKLAVGFAPDVWQCAMQGVSSPDNGPSVSTTADKAIAAAIAADYISAHSAAGSRK
jgi:hypothetical protein